MARFRIECEGCGLDEVLDDDEPPAEASPERWDAKSAAREVRSNHRLCDGETEIERIE